MPQDADYDMMENIHKLRESVLEAITGIIQGVKGQPPFAVLQGGMAQYAEPIMQFLRVVDTVRTQALLHHTQSAETFDVDQGSMMLEDPQCRSALGAALVFPLSECVFRGVAG